MLSRGQQNHAANFGKPERRFHIKSREYRFDRNPMRLKFLDQAAEQRVDFAQPLREMIRSFARGAQSAKTQHPAAAAVAFNHSVARGSGSGRIHTEHPEEIPIQLRGMHHGTECTAARRARPQFFQCRVLGASQNGSRAAANFKRPDGIGAFEIARTSAKAELFRGHDCLDFFLIDIEVGGNFLNVVMLFERLDEP